VTARVWRKAGPEAPSWSRSGRLPRREAGAWPAQPDGIKTMPHQQRSKSMDPSTPLVLAAARYASRDDAVEAFKIVWGARHQGEFDHTDVAVLTKDAAGDLQVERHDSTAKHFAWGGALLGAALVIVAPAAGIAAVAAGGAAGAGAGGLVGHFWHTISKEHLREVSDLLDSGESGLLIIAVNHKGTDITPLLENAEKKTVIETQAGDLDAAFEDGVKKAQASRGH
jgi:uncharacterized membrane protein